MPSWFARYVIAAARSVFEEHSLHVITIQNTPCRYIAYFQRDFAPPDLESSPTANGLNCYYYVCVRRRKES